jgi:hypothetical protein
VINIISTQATKNQVNGPYKVFANLIKGLDRLGYPYVINRDLNATRRLWIHDNPVALRYLHLSKSYKVLGPNLANIPEDLSNNKLKDSIYLVPSQWYSDLWQKAGFIGCPVLSWPVGIDSDEFFPFSSPNTPKKILVYHKRRSMKELNYIINILCQLKLSFQLVYYGGYEEAEFKQILKETSFAIWHDGSETQAIAMQEVMSCNIPILVCDIDRLSQSVGGYIHPDYLSNCNATSAPYFNHTCGIRIMDLSNLSESILKMIDTIEEFKPRDYILQNLSLEGQATAFIKVWERWGLTLKEGYLEEIQNTKLYHPPFSYKIYSCFMKAKKYIKFTPHDRGT